jgi:adenosine deaminase
VRELADRQILLGICPQSNITLGLYPSRAAHPLEQLRQVGIYMSLNTDDPSLLQVDLCSEFMLAQAAFGWTGAVCAEVAANGICAPFADDDIKSKLLSGLARWQS